MAKRVRVRVAGAPKGREKQTARAAGGALKRIGQRLQSAAPMAMAAPMAAPAPAIPPPMPAAGLGVGAGAGRPPGFKRGGKVRGKGKR